MSLEGLGRMLDPGFDMVAEATPYLARRVRERAAPEAVLKRGIEGVGDALNLVSGLPGDLRRLLRFLADVKSGVADVEAPVYSHVAYDIVAGECHHVRQPDILIVEGLNVLQTGSGRGGRGPHMFVSDFFDFTLYIDAVETDVEQWYVERFLKLRATVFQSPSSYFHRYATLNDTEAEHTARQIWRTINLVNLRENVAPTRERAHLILEKGRDHAVRRVRLRKV